MNERSSEGKTRILEACRGISVNIECVEGFFIKKDRGKIEFG
jgi:hypothetical protein